MFAGFWNVHISSKTQSVNAKRRKIERAKIWVSQIFFMFFDFDPQTYNFYFFRNKCLERPKFWSYPKKEDML